MNTKVNLIENENNNIIDQLILDNKEIFDNIDMTIANNNNIINPNPVNRRNLKKGKSPDEDQLEPNIIDPINNNILLNCNNNGEKDRDGYRAVIPNRRINRGEKNKSQEKDILIAQHIIQNNAPNIADNLIIDKRRKIINNNNNNINVYTNEENNNCNINPSYFSNNEINYDFNRRNNKFNVISL